MCVVSGDNSTLAIIANRAGCVGTTSNNADSACFVGDGVELNSMIPLTHGLPNVTPLAPAEISAWLRNVVHSSICCPG